MKLNHFVVALLLSEIQTKPLPLKLAQAAPESPSMESPMMEPQGPSDEGQGPMVEEEDDGLEIVPENGEFEDYEDMPEDEEDTKDDSEKDLLSDDNGNQILTDQQIKDLKKSQKEEKKKDQTQIDKNNEILQVVDESVTKLEDKSADYSNEEFKSNMTSTQWEANELETQLELFRNIILEQNTLMEEVTQNEIEKQLLEQVITQKQDELDEKLAQVQKLSQDILKAAETALQAKAISKIYMEAV